MAYSTQFGINMIKADFLDHNLIDWLRRSGRPEPDTIRYFVEEHVKDCVRQKTKGMTQGGLTSSEPEAVIWGATKHLIKFIRFSNSQKQIV